MSFPSPGAQGNGLWPCPSTQQQGSPVWPAQTYQPNQPCWHYQPNQYNWPGTQPTVPNQYQPVPTSQPGWPGFPPTQPIQPMLPTQPIPPSQPILPIPPTQPTQPIPPTQPILPIPPTQPIHPIPPTQPILPIPPTQPIHPIPPTQPILPIPPTQPSQPGQPSQTNWPSQLPKPTPPSWHGNPGQPGWPGQGPNEGQQAWPPAPTTGPLPVPFIMGFPRGIYNKLMLTIRGQVKPGAKMFTLNFLRGNDIALHVNPRFDEMGKQALVRNHKLGEQWGPEERDLLVPFPFAAGQHFEMKIFCTVSEFKVLVNNAPVFDFTYRIKEVNQIDRINILHDVNLTFVNVETLP